MKNCHTQKSDEKDKKRKKKSNLPFTGSNNRKLAYTEIICEIAVMNLVEHFPLHHLSPSRDDRMEQ